MKGKARGSRGIWGIVVTGALVFLTMLSVLGCERRKPPRTSFQPTAPTVSTATPSSSAQGETPTETVVTTTAPLVEQAGSATATSVPSPVLTPTTQPTMVAATATASPTFTPLPPTATPVPTPAVIYHTVKTGENLSRIAQLYHTTPAAILAENPSIQDPDHLLIGTVLTITEGDAPAASPIPGTRTHVVQRGETIYTIARKYGVSPQALLQANGISNPNRILVGQVLVIP